MNPKISIVICTYNGEKIISRCIDSILNQEYKNFEILCVDGGSKDKTLEIIKNYSDKRIKIINNKNRLPEGVGNGKWLGFKKCRGEIIGFIDQDNELQRKDLLNIIIKTFKQEKNVVGILGGLKHEALSKPVTRYISLIGTDSFFSYRSIDFLRNINDYSINNDLDGINIELDNTQLTGGNCFFYKKNDLKKIGGYSQDVIIIKDLVKVGKNKLLIVIDSTTHYSEESFLKLIKKKFRWGKVYFKDKKQKTFNYFPNTHLEKITFFKTIIFNLLILPNFYYSIKLYNKSRDFVAFMFPFIAFMNTFAYFLSTARSIIISKPIKN
ncbi:MAG: glycosyltransferase family 2 protein [Candidatus Pacearchaeota archaeon]|jgi:glycosyltransferase involved in cell wall biosynthesis